MSDLPELETIARLMALARQYGVEELEVEEGGFKVTLLPPRLPQTQAEPAEGGLRYELWEPPAAWALGDVSAADAKPARSESAVAVPAPLTGTFYRTPGPDEPSFVEVGDTLEEGQQIGIIEAMKVFSPVNADRGGIVLEILGQNGKLVNHGEPLLYLEPLP